MKPRTYRWFMHPNCQDVCIRMAVIQRAGEEDLVAGPEWWNLGYTGSPWYVQEAVFPKNFKEWIEISEWVFVPRINAGLPGPYQAKE